LLHVPFEFTRDQLLRNREGEDRAYLQGERDIHEEDIGFQQKVRQEYEALQHLVEDLVLVDCSDGSGGMRSPGAISADILKELKVL
jgi:thymidylate kinase